MNTRLTTAALLSLSLFIGSGMNAGHLQAASESNSPVLSVLDAFAEVRSGPGRGYPVFHSVEQGETIELITRRPGWYEIKTANGKVGWTTEREISRTIQATGEPADLPLVSYGDFLENTWWSGFSSGRLFTGELENFDALSLTVGYRFKDWISAAGEYGRAYGSDSSGSYFGALVLIEPMSNYKFSPKFSLGAGELSFDSQPKQVNVSVDGASYYSLGAGISYYIGRRFVLDVGIRQFEISNNGNDDSSTQWQLGFITFL